MNKTTPIDRLFHKAPFRYTTLLNRRILTADHTDGFLLSA